MSEPVETDAELRDFLARAAGLIGAENVVGSGDDGSYKDPYPLHPGRDPWPGVRPGSVEEVQVLVRLAGETGVGLWTVSRGKNLGYGGAEPREHGSVVLDLSRMDRIHEVDEQLGYAVVEPGVTFFDLFEHLQTNGIKLFMSVPALGWGSILGNAMDRGYGMSPLGDHFQAICGMEVVLPDGSLLRTGMWAMDGSPLGPVFKGGYGPNVESLFSQSSLGVVTKVGVWLMPWPETYSAGVIQVDEESDLPVLIDVLTDLRRRDVIQNNALCGNVVRALTMNGPRSRWYGDRLTSIPDGVLEDARQQLGIGQWNCRFGVYGDKRLAEARLAVVKDAVLAALPNARISWSTYEGEGGADFTYDDLPPQDRTQMAGVPSLGALETVKFYAENGGHIDIAPLIPAKGALVYEFYQEAKALYAKHGFDIYIGYHLYQRHMVHVTMIFFDNDDHEQIARARALYAEVLEAARRHGYAPYRGHVDNMDLIAKGFDFNDHAMQRFQERLKDALDPAGVINPGKQGVWPARLRSIDA